ncbi:hypothetical protein P775_04940 [Puniceibacterium antarcticum]|uniref:Uncharacterized protein n=1 Tax=Puniceibacterium antarcticum TaxID=1206336 RepID=A0A2G8RJS4_9RHOB|nr:hypothetical protein P775_04940 [Puniceibacterium antarcticum]
MVAPGGFAIVSHTNGAAWLIWRKIHPGIDEHALDVRAVGITSSNTGDAPMLSDLPDQIPRNQKISSVQPTLARLRRAESTPLAWRNRLSSNGWRIRPAMP